MKPTHVAVACLVVAAGVRALPQAPAGSPVNLVMPKGNGRIVISKRQGVSWDRLSLFDEGTRPVFQLSDGSSGLITSYMLFPNLTKSRSPDICRDDALDAAMRAVSPLPGVAETKNLKKGEFKTAEGAVTAAGSYLLASLAGNKVNDENVFGVQSSATVCAEIHVSKVNYSASDEAAIQRQLSEFNFDADYTPTNSDYATMASIFYTVMKDYGSAATYYQRTLDTIPPAAPLNYRRFVTDQLAMSYGLSGDLKASIRVNEAAIRADPDYPLYYYNLACADAERRKADDAKRHLQQAFDRKANTLPGEHLPDPARDDSIQKLRKNREFWEWVQTLK